MLHGRGRLAVLVSATAITVACGPTIDLSTSLAVTEVFSGWYDNGVKPGTGESHVLPTISFRLRNTGPDELINVRMTIGFWWANGTEVDTVDILAIGETPLAPGATSDPILVRANRGYTLTPPQTPAGLFTHSLYQDASARLFARKSGRIVPVGEYRLDRQVLPNTGPAQPGTE
jgi:hypothetical protein